MEVFVNVGLVCLNDAQKSYDELRVVLYLSSLLRFVEQPVLFSNIFKQMFKQLPNLQLEKAALRNLNFALFGATLFANFSFAYQIIKTDVNPTTLLRNWLAAHR